MIHAQKVRELVNSSKNAMVGLYRAFSYHLQLFSNVSIDFFRDLDRLYSHIRHDYDRTHSHNQKQLQDYMERGVSEGVFRDDIDYQVHIALLEFQMEALKRLEYNFPPNITLPKAIEHINYSFLRAVATPKGLEMLEDAIQSQNTFIEHDSDE
ncbi:MAG: hypothetical protein K2N03_03125, partial [Muribaculaceae bacterium]|nr:hypothetical protein [Muribaculaceae bacterium]